MSRNRPLAANAALLLAAAFARGGADDALILHESAYWRQYFRFGPDRVSTTLLKADGPALLGPAVFQKVKKETEDTLRRSGTDPSAADWREHVYVCLFFDRCPPYTAPVPADEWMAPDFDDHAWVLERGPLLSAPKGQSLPRGPGWTREDLDQTEFSSLGVQACYYRARFVVDRPEKVHDLTLRLAYRGGARAFLDGQEAACGHLPRDGPPDAPAEEYPVAAYQDRPELRDRTLGPVRIPSAILRKGTNLLAIEVRASRLHPIVLAMRLAVRNHKVRPGMVGLWPHADLSKVELRSSSPGIVSPLSRPPGVQVWVQDIHHRADSSESLPPGEPPGIVRLVGARNGTFGAQVAVAADEPLADVEVRPGELRRVGGNGRLPADALRSFWFAPYPAAEFTEKKLGDDRGLGATFPAPGVLARFEGMADTEKPHVFDHLVPAPPRRIPAKTCWPFWLSLRIPPDAEAGTYQGEIEVRAGGAAAIRLPVEAEVVDWRLPDPRDSRTLMACEQNPYGVAKPSPPCGISPAPGGFLRSEWTRGGRARPSTS